uniref:Uncharacterized protein n=3 Tax=Candidatus Kentrum sp. LPFa TaxID=2126335 RepID=A0A450WXV3_9GAMM|nr:MAG: hypothetical protein BECKLPF1236A_GA0070988_103211 [Candidatus Kentron sp. LPFa]
MSIGRDNCSPNGAITRESPGTRKTYAGKYGELTLLRQRGGGGESLPLTHYLTGIDIDNASRKIDLHRIVLNKMPSEIKALAA